MPQDSGLLNRLCVIKWCPFWQQDKYYQHCKNWSMQITGLPETVYAKCWCMWMCFIGKKVLSTFSMGTRKGSETHWTKTGSSRCLRLTGPQGCDVPDGVSLLASHSLLCFHLSLLTHTTLTPFLWFLALFSSYLSSVLAHIFDTAPSLVGWDRVLFVF